MPGRRKTGGPGGNRPGESPNADSPAAAKARKPARSSAETGLARSVRQRSQGNTLESFRASEARRRDSSRTFTRKKKPVR